jgi:cytochrome c553
MRTILRWLPLSMVLLCGCSASPPPPLPAAPPFANVVNLKQLMEWVIDPAADVVWDSVKTIITEEGTKEIAPQTDEQWAAVRNGAATLAESANLLMIEGRARDNKEWMAAARRLTTTAGQALKAAEAKDATALFTTGGDIYNACRACHERYANFDQQTAAPEKAEK